MNNDARDAMLTLALTPGMGPTLTSRCIESMGAAKAVLGADVRQLKDVPGIGPHRANALRSAMDALADGKAVSKEKQLIDQYKAAVIAMGDPDYPCLLRHIPDPPPLLYVLGELHVDDAVALAVVGTRRCTAYGREQADRLTALCSQAGLCIVSGGARGIDAVAHRAALRAGGRTIAVLGSGLARPYPREHDQLFNDITAVTACQKNNVSTCGAVISELPMSTPPLAENFPRRNRIVAGLSLGVLVIEAPIASGAMITARLAAEEQGREVMAIPGRVDSRSSTGCHKMIREGWATLVTNAADVLDCLGETGQLLKAGMTSDSQPTRSDAPTIRQQSKMTDIERRLFDALDESRSVDQLSAHTSLPVSIVQANVTMLEIRSLITRHQGKYRQRRG